MSRNGRDSPGIWPYVPGCLFSTNVPKSSSIAQMGVWLIHKLSILASFGPYLVGVPAVADLGGGGSRVSTESPFGLDLVLRSIDDRLKWNSPLWLKNYLKKIASVAHLSLP